MSIANALKLRLLFVVGRLVTCRGLLVFLQFLEKTLDPALVCFVVKTLLFAGLTIPVRVVEGDACQRS